MNPSPLAYLVLFGWPVVAVLFFWRLPAARAVTWTLLLSALFLPAGLSVDPPLVPPLHRSSIACLAGLLGYAIFHVRRLTGTPPGTGLESFVWILVAGSFATAVTNRDPVMGLPGLSLYDGLSMAIDVVFSIWIPFYLGRSAFRSPEQLVPLFRALAGVMLVYSVLILVEVRLSPQLHRWVYGYHQHEFVQTMRGDGWRPMVFMSHGLAVAQFVVFGVIASLALWLAGRRVYLVPASVATLYLSAIAVAMKTFSAALYGAGAVGVLAVLRTRWQLRAAAALAVLILLYPAARAFDLFPRDAIVAAAGSVSEARSQSLAFRLDNEDALLERARQRLVFGWGGFGRNRIYDPVTGRDLSVTDGYWIIELGTAGVTGFAATFLLVLTPVFVILRRRRRLGGRRERILVAALAWLVAISALNLIPNAELNPFILLLAGALAGLAEELAPPRRRPRLGDDEDEERMDDDEEGDGDANDEGEDERAAGGRPAAVRSLVGVREPD